MIAERSVAPGFAAFTLPTSEECLMCGLDPTEILGWYSVDANGTFRDAQAFSGTYITTDMTFYPYMKSQSFSFDKASHFPIFTTSGGSFTLTGFRGGWQVGQYTDKSIYQPLPKFPPPLLRRVPANTIGILAAFIWPPATAVTALF